MSVIETVRFRLKENVTAEEVTAAWEKSQGFATAQPGFLGRKLAVTDQGDWLDHVEWADMQSARNAAAAFDPSKHPELLDLMSVLDEASISMTHFSIKASTS